VPIVEEAGRESLRWRREEKTISRPPLGVVLVLLAVGEGRAGRLM